MIIKVCGMCYSDNIAQVEALEVSMIGHVFYPLSPRYLSDKPILSKRKKKVGVFVDQPIDDILKIANTWQLDYIQLHGDEPPSYCNVLKQYPILVIKAFRINSLFDWSICVDYEEACSLFLFDTATPQYGGSGQKFDWDMLHLYTGNTPFLLSGGISIADIDAILQFTHAQFRGVDLNSGFEISPGKKDIAKLTYFIQQINSKTISS